MSKWKYILMGIACFSLIGILIWLRLKKKNTVQELPPHLADLVKEIEEGKEVPKKLSFITAEHYQKDQEQLHKRLQAFEQQWEETQSAYSSNLKIIKNPAIQEYLKQEAKEPQKNSTKTDAEVNAWEKAKKMGTIEAYQAFLQGNYGSKVYFGAAHKAIKKLETKA